MRARSAPLAPRADASALSAASSTNAADGASVLVSAAVIILVVDVTGFSRTSAALALRCMTIVHDQLTAKKISSTAITTSRKRSARRLSPARCQRLAGLAGRCSSTAGATVSLVDPLGVSVELPYFT